MPTAVFSRLFGEIRPMGPDKMEREKPYLNPASLAEALYYRGLIGMTFGFNAGYAINPARDLGPRLFTAMAGWGGEVFRAGNAWWWVPIVGPSIGGVLGGFVYDALITRHHPR